MCSLSNSAFPHSCIIFQFGNDILINKHQTCNSRQNSNRIKNVFVSQHSLPCMYCSLSMVLWGGEGGPPPQSTIGPSRNSLIGSRGDKCRKSNRYRNKKKMQRSHEVTSYSLARSFTILRVYLPCDYNSDLWIPTVVHHLMQHLIAVLKRNL